MLSLGRLKKFRTHTMTYDLIVIGGGPGGYVAAIRAAQLGLKTAVIEKDKLGGVCLNWGCIPSKALLKSSEIMNTINKAEEFGISCPKPQVNFQKMIQRSREIADKLSSGIDVLIKSAKVDILKGLAMFKSNKEIEVNNKRYQAKNFIIATGARPRMLTSIKISNRIWTSKEAMFPPEPFQKNPPKKLLIVGSGAIGMEYASFYHNIGTKVTVVELLDRILPQEDPEISTLALKMFKKQNIAFKLKQSTKTLDEKSDHIEVTFDSGEKEKFDAVVIAIGVIGNTENIGLENTKIKTENNKIIINEYNQTHEANIYAIGDVVNPPWLAHKASHEGTMVVEKIKGLPVKPLKTERIPACTYCAPQIASIGLSETKAKEEGHTIKVGRFPFQANGKALAMGAKEGLIKTIFDAKTGQLLGAHLIGEEVTELIHSFAIAMEIECTEEELMHTIFPHPTLSEMIHESTLNAFGKTLHLPN